MGNPRVNQILKKYNIPENVAKKKLQPKKVKRLRNDQVGRKDWQDRYQALPGQRNHRYYGHVYILWRVLTDAYYSGLIDFNPGLKKEFTGGTNNFRLLSVTMMKGKFCIGRSHKFSFALQKLGLVRRLADFESMKIVISFVYQMREDFLRTKYKKPVKRVEVPVEDEGGDDIGYDGGMIIVCGARNTNQAKQIVGEKLGMDPYGLSITYSPNYRVRGV